MAAALRLLEAIALAHQDVHFRVSHNGRPALGAPRARSLRDRIGALWGFERAGKLLEVERKDGPLAVSGLVAPPQLARGNRDEIVLIVNGRPVRDTQLAQTLIEAYRPLLARDQFPVAVLHLELPPAGSGRQRPPDQGLGPLPLAPPGAGDPLPRGARCASAEPRSSSRSAASRAFGRIGATRQAMRPEASLLKAGAQKWPPHSPSPRTFRLLPEPGPTLPRAPGTVHNRQLRDRHRPAPGHVHRRRDRRRDLLPGPARGARARAVRAAAGRSGRGPAGLAGAALPAAAWSWARARRPWSRSGPRRSRAWASGSRAGAAPRSCCARCPRCSGGRSRGG